MMNKLEIEYQTVDISQDPAALEMLLEKGFQSAPVVITQDDAWAGFQPDKINEIVGGH
jgi:glutaredoxin-like protein NrdH